MNCKLRTKYGFTLIEVLMAMVLVALAITSLFAAAKSFTSVNAAGSESTTAEFLIEQIRELTTMTGYDNLYSYDGVNYSPPHNTAGAPLNNFAAYTQQVTVENVSDTNFELVVPDHTSSFVRVTVKILLNSKEITSESWIRANIGS